MKTTAVRLYGKRDLRLETFELPEIGEGDILARVISDSVCMSTYKAAIQGADHKRVPNDVATNPVMVGHELCGEILEVGARWQSEFKPGQRFTIQPALNDPENPFGTPGYAFHYLGGDATYIVIPARVMEAQVPAALRGRGVLLRLAGRAGVLHNRRLSRKLPYHARRV